MFYCDTCAKARNWPEAFTKSVGPCEVCGNRTLCNDRPSSTLPKPPSDKVDVTIKLSEREHEVLQEMAKDLDLTPEQVLRQGLRTYQMQHESHRNPLPELSKAPPIDPRPINYLYNEVTGRCDKCGQHDCGGHPLD